MSSDAASKKILVVADEPDTRIFLANLLNAVGFESMDACSMPEALAIAKTNHPSLIILDVMMSNKGGIYMYHQLKNDDQLKAVPVIMLSAIDRDTFFLYEKFKTTSVGPGLPKPDGYLEKPPEADALIQLVHSLMPLGEERETT